MDRDSAVALLKYRLGNNVNDNLDTLIVAEMQHVQDTILEQGEYTPWFLEKSGTLATVADTRAVTLPSDFLKESNTQALWRYGTAGDETTLVELVKGDADELDYLYGSDSEAPKAYCLFGETSLQLWPIPDAAYSLKIVYYGTDTVLSSNVENKWLKYAADLFIAETGIIIAGQYEQSPRMEAAFMKARDKAMRRLITHEVARAEANHDRVRGGA